MKVIKRAYNDTIKSQRGGSPKRSSNLSCSNISVISLATRDRKPVRSNTLLSEMLLSRPYRFYVGS
jgi:hypothetical protein